MWQCQNPWKTQQLKLWFWHFHTLRWCLSQESRSHHSLSSKVMILMIWSYGVDKIHLFVLGCQILEQDKMPWSWAKTNKKMQLPFVTSTGGVAFLMKAVYNFLKLGTAEDTSNLLPFLKGQTIMNQSWGPAFEHVFLKIPSFFKYKLSWLYMHRL